jgi:hypothetical protein
MRFVRKNILFLFFLLISFVSSAQINPSSICRVENGKIQYSLDPHWTDSQKKEVQKLFNLDSTIWVKIKSNSSEILLDSVSWKVKHVSGTQVLVFKEIDKEPFFHFDVNDIFLTGENWQVTPGYVDQDKVICGVNSYKKQQCFQYTKGSARFYLPGYLKAQHAFIAGNFNNWDPLATSMQKVDTGWVVTIPLRPGKYFYKFIIDGNWMHDSNNSLSENDGQGNVNSTVFCPNHLFQLKGYSKSRRVIVSGTFNSWSKKEFKMIPGPQGWTLPMYLKDGTYSYKFIVDDEWITDPANTFTRTDANGFLNSVIGFGDVHVFRLKAYLNSEKVILTGSFNNWDTNELVMEKTPDGWQMPLQLAPGNYEYKFIVDGRWMNDPANPITTGSGDYVNSCFAFKANYVFTLNKFQDAKEVKLTGSFNAWNREGYKMLKKDGKWFFPIYLSPGKYLYKIIVDGEWITDPTNPLWEENEYGTGNSVLWITPR